MTSKRLKPQLRQQLWECQACGEVRETVVFNRLVAESREPTLFCQQCGTIKRKKEVTDADQA